MVMVTGVVWSGSGQSVGFLAMSGPPDAAALAATLGLAGAVDAGADAWGLGDGEATPAQQDTTNATASGSVSSDLRRILLLLQFSAVHHALPVSTSILQRTNRRASGRCIVHGWPLQGQPCNAPSNVHRIAARPTTCPERRRR